MPGTLHMGNSAFPPGHLPPPAPGISPLGHLPPRPWPSPRWFPTSRHMSSKTVWSVPVDPQITIPEYNITTIMARGKGRGVRTGDKTYTHQDIDPDTQTLIGHTLTQTQKHWPDTHWPTHTNIDPDGNDPDTHKHWPRQTDRQSNIRKLSLGWPNHRPLMDINWMWYRPVSLEIILLYSVRQN